MNNTIEVDNKRYEVVVSPMAYTSNECNSCAFCDTNNCPIVSSSSNMLCLEYEESLGEVVHFIEIEP